MYNCVAQQSAAFYSTSASAVSVRPLLLRPMSSLTVCLGSSSTNSRSCSACRSTKSSRPELGGRLKLTAIAWLNRDRSLSSRLIVKCLCVCVCVWLTRYFCIMRPFLESINQSISQFISWTRYKYKQRWGAVSGTVSGTTRHTRLARSTNSSL